MRGPISNRCSISTFHRTTLQKPLNSRLLWHFSLLLLRSLRSLPIYSRSANSMRHAERRWMHTLRAWRMRNGVVSRRLTSFRRSIGNRDYVRMKQFTIFSDYFCRCCCCCWGRSMLIQHYFNDCIVDRYFLWIAVDFSSTQANADEKRNVRRWLRRAQCIGMVQHCVAKNNNDWP